MKTLKRMQPNNIICSVERNVPMKRLLTVLLVITMLFSLAVPAIAEGNERPGARWIDSGIYGAFEGRSEIRPQDDFAAAVNREWAETVRIPEGASNVSARTEQTENYNQAKLAVLKGEKKDDPDVTSLQHFYTLLLDWDARNKAGLEPIKPYAEDLMSVSSIEEMTRYYADPDRNIFGTPMVTDELVPDPDDALTSMLDIMEVVTLVNTPDDFRSEAEESAGLTAKRRTAEYMLKRLGYAEEEAKAIFDRAKEFESKLLPFAQAQEKDATGDPTIMLSVADFENRYQHFPLAAIYRGLGYDIKGRVCLRCSGTLDGIEANYTDENLENVKAWTLVNTLLAFTNYFDRETYETAAKFQEPLTGTGDVKNDDTYALEVMDAVVPTLMDQMYVNYCFDKEIKPQVAELTRMMIDAYRDMIREEDWLDDATKAGAIEKLDHFKMNICYPDKLPEIGTVTIGTAEEGETVFSAILKGRKFLNQVEATALTWKNDGTYWRYDNYYSTLTACYIAEENSINIYAGICGGDYYDPDWPLEKKLGGLCMIVGHEITHAFDTKGSQYDKDGNKKNWWTEEDRKAFQERVDRLVAFYSDLVPMPQISDQTYGEDGAMRIKSEAIADLGSLKCLLSIAKKQEHFDYDLFFRQIAVIQKQARYEAAERNYVATNEHPVEAYRCNIPVQNYDEFLETYGIKEGDGMYLAPEDRIRVW